MAFIAANRLRLRHLAEEGSTTAARYLEAFSRPERILSTAMVGVTISHIVASSIATVVLIPVYGGWAWPVATPVDTPGRPGVGGIHPQRGGRRRGPFHDLPPPPAPAWAAETAGASG